MRQTIDSLLFKTNNVSTNQSSDSEILCPEERIKELELRTQRRNNFEDELFKDKFPTEEELAYHKELLGEPLPPFSTLEPKIRRGDPWSLKIPCVIGTVYTGLHTLICNLLSTSFIFDEQEASRGDSVAGIKRRHRDPSGEGVRDLVTASGRGQFNEDLENHLQAIGGKRGLRQGDPLSPYLFTLVMEVLTLMLQRMVMVSNTFSYHRYCDKLNLINLCFADDLFLFAYGDVDSTRVIKEGLDEFKIASGLIPSLPKSTAYFCNVLNHVKISILNVLPFEEGRLPVKYLGVPLVSSRLMVRDCKELVEKVKNRIHDWRNKSLSMAGRLQLIRSVIGSMHVFWASVFIIPNGVLVDIEQCMRNFLWSPGASLKGKAKVAWDVVCLPKDEGGLGIRRLDHFNSALMVSHIWKLLSLKESLWVKWIHAYKLCGRNFWDIPLRGNMSWGWRKILQLRPIVREFIWHKVGNGSNTSLWYDRWCAASPLANHVSNRDVFRAGLSLSSCISDIVAGNVWNWPSDLIDKYPLLNSCKVPLSSEVDSLEWRLHDGAVKNFSISQVWSNIRPRDVKVPWYHMVWFPLSIPRHAFNMWLIVKRKLKTQDRINPWDVVSSLGITCSLCDDVPDSHEHLFFNCSYASAVWNHMKHRADLGHVLHDVYAIIDHFGDSAKRKSSRVVIAKLVVAASAYFIWQKRNWRLFKGTKRSVQQVIDCIVSAVRLKLLTCRFKRSKDGSRYARLWDLPDSIFR
ncbi:putative RNA-directed DNA polymerase [Tanacetum coccineum]|uniref:RNA-directed DNA polymerase n=1 Tax=Tanacetum coccineum TaxID=301880 RepID=A0ABQ4XS88_9ASTR